MKNDPYAPDENLKFDTSDKTSTFGEKPHIKKGYYPGKLLSIKPFKDRDGNWKDQKYGRQLIFEFAVYKADPDNGAPLEPMQTQNSETGEMEDVILPKFVYHQYNQKDKKTGKVSLVTAITPNSMITKILKNLGWEFTGEGVDMKPFIGNWVELNIDDWKHQVDNEEHVASTIKDVNPYEGPAVGEEIEEPKEATKKEPKKVEKQVKHNKVEETSDEEQEPEEDAPEEEQEPEEAAPEEKPEKPVRSGDVLPEDLNAKKEELKKLLDEGVLSKEGYEQAIAQIDAKLKDVKK